MLDRPLFLAIPAYNPAASLIELVEAAERSRRFQGIVVVDDGSFNGHEIFDRVRSIPTVVVLRHAVNLGKGAALKTALNSVLVEHGDQIGIVTMDADGQHAMDDVLRVAQELCRNPDSLVLGVRLFSKGTPLRSRVGNWLTGRLTYLLLGLDLADTQTGLRGIPGRLGRRLLLLPSQRYEFELDMLVLCAHLAVPVSQQPISAIYIEQNRSSHFNPLTDSLMIYSVLFRFIGASLISAVFDNLLFTSALVAGLRPFVSHLSARVFSLSVNYALLRRFVFLSEQRHRRVFPKYIAMTAVWASIALLLIDRLVSSGALSLGVAKIAVESLLFPANFIIQRRFVFSNRRERL